MTCTYVLLRLACYLMKIIQIVCFYNVTSGFKFKANLMFLYDYFRSHRFIVFSSFQMFILDA